MASFTVIYDANVLYPAPLRSILMFLAQTDLFRARWTMDIHEEWIRNLLLKRPDLSREKLEGLREMMIRAIPDSLVTGFEPAIDGLTLPDQDDRHVLAAALRANAEIIVTANLKDFPTENLKPYNVVAQHPDDFILDLIDLRPPLVLTCLKEDRMHYSNPPSGLG
ncbi:MAG: PIN domain-containing protein [Hahellaceae bacterium]|jgi:predicted nucleic acid-binding protein|nr:PIN domain-containing protein [Hahellaceae bacterium]